MYWLYSVLVCAVSQYLGDMDTEGGPSVHEDETTPLLPLLYIPARVLFPGETRMSKMDPVIPVMQVYLTIAEVLSTGH